jgi:hypothetical protein
VHTIAGTTSRSDIIFRFFRRVYFACILRFLTILMSATSLNA